jgi:glycosyltransferase involved in cell wall biosynthesis
MTDSPINKVSGGGIVSLNLLETLQEVSNVKLILSGQHFEDSKYGEIPSYCIKPGQFSYYDPFFSDYFAKALLDETNKPLELGVSYGCPWGNIFEKLKKDYLCKLVADLAPHNIETSMREHLKWIGNYPYPHLTNSFLWKMYSKHLRLADVVVVHSKSSAEYLEKAAELKEAPRVIPHGCYPPLKIPKYPTIITPGYFGALGMDKGIIYMVNAWLKCNYKSKLIIGGHGASGFNLNEGMDKFHILGAVDDIANFYSKISFYIQPSVVEGFGITPLEAMAFGRPVIVAEGAGMCELVTDGKDGFVVPIQSANAIKNRIEYFYDNHTEIKRMGIEARKTAEQYTWSIIKQKYIEIYKELLE